MCHTLALDAPNAWRSDAANQECGARTTILLVSATSLATAIGLGVGFAISNQGAQEQFVRLAAFGSVLGLTGLLNGAFSLFPSTWERRSNEFARKVEAGKSAEAIREVDRFVERQLGDTLRDRIGNGVFGGLMMAGGAAGLTWMFVEGQAQPIDLFVIAASLTSVISGALLVGLALEPSTTESFGQLLRQERPPEAPKLGFAIIPGGGGLSLSGQF